MILRPDADTRLIGRGTADLRTGEPVCATLSRMAPSRDVVPQAKAIRASDDDRERVADLLRRHYASGRLSDEDLSTRVDAAYSRRTVDELEALVADLPSDRTPAGRRRRRGGLETSVRIHATVYAVVNVVLVAMWAVAGGGEFWPVWSILGWGIGLGAHAAPLLAGVGGPSSHPPHRPRVEPGASAGTATPATPTTPVEEVAEAVTAERPTLKPGAAPDGTVTLLFSDIEGSSALNERLGDLRWLELLELHNRLIRDQVRECGGYEVKAQGDGFMLAFASARRAIACARAIQEVIDEQLGGHPDGPVRVRIGLHTGEAIRQDSDYYGKNVVVAARIAALAQGGEILASAVVKHLTESAGDVRFEDERSVELPGLDGTHAVYRVA